MLCKVWVLIFGILSNKQESGSLIKRYSLEVDTLSEIDMIYIRLKEFLQSCGPECLLWCDDEYLNFTSPSSY